MTPNWSIDELADIVAAGLTDANEALREENAVRGLDHLHETDLHTVIEAAFLHADLGVIREQPFPSHTKRNPKASERERCDLVVLPDAEAELADPIRVRAETEAASATLFADASFDPAPINVVQPADAFWIEIKSTGQFIARDDVPQPNNRYTTELVRLPGHDIRKLARERALVSAACVVVLFAESEQTARHDLAHAVHRWLDDDVPLRSPAIRVVEIDERIGNAVAAVCVIPIRATLT